MPAASTPLYSLFSAVTLLLLCLLLPPSSAAAAAAAAPASLQTGIGSRAHHSSNASFADPLAAVQLPHRPHARTATYIHMELLLRQVVEECAKRQDSVLQFDAAGRLQVLRNLPADAPCPALDIPIKGSQRGVGMCTDAALYLLHLGRTGTEGRGGRILPLLPAADMAAYSAKCTQTTARMSLKNMYREWVAPEGTSGYHLMQVNSEHMFRVHEPLHKRIDVFLCKTEVCQQLMVQYVTKQGWRAEVWYIGHTSSDVLVTAPANNTWASSSSSKTSSTEFIGLASSPQQPGQQQQQQQQQPGASPIQADYSRFLHVKGKSGLKHTQQLLECWAQHPEFPLLTVVGQSSLDDVITRRVAKGSISNIRLLPRPARDVNRTAALRDMARRLAVGAARKQPAADASTGAGVKRRLLSSSAAAAAAVRRLFSSSSSGGSVAAHQHDKALQAAVEVAGWQPYALNADQLLTFEDVRQLEAASGVHICASEREGFGHYINEARAAGALVISTDHPPMNELVQDGVSGVLVTPARTASYEEWQALGSFQPLNAYLTPADICTAVKRVLAMPLQQRQQLGHQARQQYLHSKVQFVHRMRVLRRLLHRRRMEGRFGSAGQPQGTDTN